MENEATETSATESPSRQFIGVRYLNAMGVHRYEAMPSLRLRRGDLVVVSTEQGHRLGTVTDFSGGEQEDAKGSARRILRKASSGDLDRSDRLRGREREAVRACLGRIRELDMDMKLISAEQNHEGGKIVFYFSAPRRIDFRDLVRDLAQQLHARIEMRQVGSREEAKAIGAAGPCGRELCCSTWLRSPGAVSVKMAKAQGLSLNPSKLAGMCGRLKCCLRYEYDTYLELGRSLPPVGTRVVSLQGEGVVMRQNPMKQTVLVQLDANGVFAEATLEDLVRKKGE